MAFPIPGGQGVSQDDLFVALQAQMQQLDTLVGQIPFSALQAEAKSQADNILNNLNQIITSMES